MNKKGALGTVFLVVLVDLIGFGIVLPGLHFYASEFNSSPWLIGVLYSSYSFAQLVFSPVWGSVSDRVGRRPVMMISTFSASLAYLLFGLSHSFAMLLVSRIFAGIMAGNISTAQAYVADVTSESERIKGMGLIGAAFGIGFVLGPAAGGIIMSVFKQNHYLIVGLFASALSLLSFLLVSFLLPESVQLSRNEDNQRIEKIGIFSGQFWRFVGEAQSAGGIFLWLLLSVFLLTLGQASIYEAFPFFCNVHLNLGERQVYMQYVWMGLVAVLIQGGLIRRLEKIFGEKRLFVTGCAVMAVGLGSIPFAASLGTLTFIMIVMTIGASLSGPSLNSLVSKQAPASRFGITMGISQSFSALARAIGPTWGGVLLGLSYQAPFLITALLVSTTLAVGFKLLRESAC